VSHTAHLQIKTWKGKKGTTMVIMVTMGGDLQPGRLADRLLTGLGQLQINPLQWWPSARLFGWSAADWSRPATNKSVSSERKRKSLVFCWERKSWTSWLLTCRSKKGWAAVKSSKRCIQEGNMFPQLTNSMILAKGTTLFDIAALNKISKQSSICQDQLTDRMESKRGD